MHKFNDRRRDYIIDRIAWRFHRSLASASPYAGVSLIDVGCGGGLRCKPLAAARRRWRRHRWTAQYRSRAP